jgi:hypothetical protein
MVPRCDVLTVDRVTLHMKTVDAVRKLEPIATGDAEGVGLRCNQHQECVRMNTYNKERKKASLSLVPQTAFTKP